MGPPSDSATAALLQVHPCANKDKLMTKPQIAEIAAKLTPAQKRALLWAPNDTEWMGCYNLGGFKQSYAAMDRADLGKPQLTEVRCDVTGVYDARLTALGQSVAAYLKEQRNGA